MKRKMESPAPLGEAARASELSSLTASDNSKVTASHPDLQGNHAALLANNPAFLSAMVQVNATLKTVRNEANGWRRRCADLEAQIRRMGGKPVSPKKEGRP